MALLKHMFNMAERWGQNQGTNPVRLVRFLPEDNLRFDTLSEEQEQRLLLASPPYLRDMILFAINTGLRTSDIFNLEWREVDIEQRRLKKIVKKNQRPLSLPLNDTAFGIVEARRGIQHGPYVFYNPMTGDKFKDVKGAIAAAVKRAGLGKITLAYVPPYFCFAAHSRGSRHRDRQGATRAFQYQHHDALRSLERRGEASGGAALEE
jgi:integrase